MLLSHEVTQMHVKASLCPTLITGLLLCQDVVAEKYERYNRLDRRIVVVHTKT